MRGPLPGHVFELVGLGANDGLSIADLLVNGLAIPDVNKGTEVNGGHGNHSETPERDDADQPVTSEGSSESLEDIRNDLWGTSGKTYTNGVNDVLGEQDALELDKEEIHQLRHILKHGFGSFLWDGVVAAGAEGARDSLLEDNLAYNLDGGGHCNNWSMADPLCHRSRDQLTSKRHVQKLEGPAKERQITSRKDESDDAGIRNGGRTGLFPLHKSQKFREWRS